MNGLQIPKDPFELMRQLRDFEKGENIKLHAQQKQNRFKKQEVVRESLEVICLNISMFSSYYHFHSCFTPGAS